MLPREFKALLLVLLLGANGMDPRLFGEELPVEVFVTECAQHQQVSLSPSGRYLGCLTPKGNRTSLAVVDRVAGQAALVFNTKDADVAWFAWVSDKRLVFWMRTDKFGRGGLFAVNRDGKRLLWLTEPKVGVPPVAFDSLPEGEEDKIRVITHAGDLNGNIHPHLARLDVNTGSRQLLASNPGHVVEWLCDHEGVARVGVEMKGDQIRVVHRETVDKPWDVVTAFHPADAGLLPHAFTGDNRSLYVVGGKPDETEGLYRLALDGSKSKELLFRHQEADVTGILVDRVSRALTGVTYEREKPEVFWVDPEMRRMQASIDRVFTNTLNTFVSSSHDGTVRVFLASSDRDPGTYYLLDWVTKRWEKVLDVAAPGFPVSQMAGMKPIQYKARDGLTIHGYLTRPQGSAGGPVPIIINPHGGPASRDSWGFNPEVQFLANRGYAVLQVNFRGSTGYGGAFQRAGDREWGRKMQDDLTDAVRWAIDQKITEPGRVAIVGASYGGYATMAGLAFTPELYCCGVNLAGVTDITLFLKRSIPPRKAVRAWAAAAIGDPRSDSEQLEKYSPLQHVSQIRAPVFLAYGELDERVPLEQGQRLAAELTEHGKTFELMIKSDEGHGFFRVRNQIEYYQRVGAFLKKYLR